MAHGANPPCNLCKVRAQKLMIGKQSKWAYTSCVHSKNSATSRSIRRNLQVRSAGITKPECNYIGLHETDSYSITDYPLVHLQVRLHKAVTTAIASGETVTTVPMILKAFPCSIVAILGVEAAHCHRSSFWKFLSSRRQCNTSDCPLILLLVIHGQRHRNIRKLLSSLPLHKDRKDYPSTTLTRTIRY